MRARATSLAVAYRDESDSLGEVYRDENARQIVSLLLKRSRPRYSRRPDVADLHWMLAVHSPTLCVLCARLMPMWRVRDVFARGCARPW